MADSYQVISTTDIYRTFDFLKLKRKLVSPIIKEVKKWERLSGPEWTVQRLKSLKHLFLQHYAGNRDYRLPHSAGIACYTNTGIPKGPFKGLWTVGTSYGAVNKVMTVLQLYTAYTWLGVPTKKQLNKFLTAVRNPRQEGILPEWDIDPTLWWSIRLEWRNARYDRVDHWVSSSRKKVLSFKPTKKGGRFRQTEETALTVEEHRIHFLLSASTLLKSKRIVNVCKKAGLVKSVLDVKMQVGSIANSEKMLSVMKKRNISKLIKTFQDPLAGPVSGSIGFIQERGMKLRSVANPLRMYQVALSKLQMWLKEVARTILYWDCTFDQMRGVRWAERKLSKKIKLFAFDLSNASDTIPLADQIALLQYLAPDTDDPTYEEYVGAVELFTALSKGRWVMYTPGSFDFLVWAKGQPLGLGPSFGLFSLAHGLRLHMFARERGLDNDFVVLGDDVIVTEALADVYAQFLDQVWGCDVSIEKTLVSNQITEFASKLITSEGLIRSWKFPKGPRMFSTRDPLSLLWKYGKDAIRMVPSEFRETVKLLASLPEPSGLGISWDDEESSFPDGGQFLDMLFPPKREPIHDVAYASFHRKVGARYDSVIVRDTPYIETLQRLSVAFRAIGNDQNLLLSLGPISKEGYTRSTQQGVDGASVVRKQLQWLVLHSNCNLSNTDYLFFDSIEESVRRYPRVLTDRDSLLEVNVRKLHTPTRLSAFNSRLRKAADAAFKYLVSFFALLKRYSKIDRE